MNPNQARQERIEQLLKFARANNDFETIVAEAMKRYYVDRRIATGYAKTCIAIIADESVAPKVEK